MTTATSLNATAATTTPTPAAAATPVATPAVRHAIHWFEIPVADIDRAQAFYESMLGAPLRREAMGPQTLAVLPYAQPGVGGALLASPTAPPPGAGTLVYLNAGRSVAMLEATLARALAAGGALLMPRVDLPDGMGSFVHIRDSEGNRVGLHVEA